ncbi:MAG: ATP-binding protein, partial [Anaerolineae bacterium]
MSVIGREREQALLTTVYEREGAQFLVLYGRRRIGKTTLIQHWSATKLSEGEALYWVATQTSATNQLRAFSQALFRHI